MNRASLAALKNEPAQIPVTGDKVAVPDPVVQSADVAPHHSGFVLGIDLEEPAASPVLGTGAGLPAGAADRTGYDLAPALPRQAGRGAGVG